jgi:hypothetical protein
MYAWYKMKNPTLSAPASVETICKYLAEWRAGEAKSPLEPGTYRIIDTDDWVADGPAR